MSIFTDISAELDKMLPDLGRYASKEERLITWARQTINDDNYMFESRESRTRRLNGIASFLRRNGISEDVIDRVVYE